MECCCSSIREPLIVGMRRYKSSSRKLELCGDLNNAERKLL
jgi:hypothetical protein